MRAAGRGIRAALSGGTGGNRWMEMTESGAIRDVCCIIQTSGKKHYQTSRFLLISFSILNIRAFSETREGLFRTLSFRWKTNPLFINKLYEKRFH